MFYGCDVLVVGVARGYKLALAASGVSRETVVSYLQRIALAAMHRRLGRLQVRVRCPPSGVQGRIGCQVQEKDEEL